VEQVRFKSGMEERGREGWLSPTELASVSAISLRHILASPAYAPGIIAVNVTWIERGFNAGQSVAAYTNYLQPFTNYSEILVGNFNFFLPPLGLHLTPPLGCSHWNSGKKFGPQKTRIMGLPGSEDSLTIG